MAPQARSKRQRKSLAEFRLVTAREIIRYQIHTGAASIDIEDAGHIAELCDDYALAILLSWLATKYGFPAYKRAIDSKSSVVRLLEDWPSLREEYPLLMAPETYPGESAAHQVLEPLAEDEQPELSLVGSLYEQICECPLKIGRDGLPYIERSDKRKLSGQFYTPPYVVSYCLNAALTENSTELISTIKAAVKARSDQGLEPERQFKMIDPSCGTGNFLVGALNWFFNQHLTPHEVAHLAENSLYGIDLDGRAAALARMSLVLCLAPYWKSLAQTSTLQQVDSEISKLMSHLRQNIAVSDSTLQSQVPNQGFDLTITNPPYVSFGSRNQTRMPASWSRLLRSLYPSSSEYKIRVHSIFQDISLRMTRDGGRVGLLLPDAFLTGSYYGRLRKHLLKEAQIISLTELPDNIIDGATVGRWCVAVYEKRARPAKDYQVLVRSVTGRTGPSTGTLEPQRSYSLPLSFLVSSDGSRFRLVFDPMDQEIWQVLGELKPLGNYLTGHTGIRALNGQSSVLSSRRENNDHQKGIASGSRVSRHKVIWDGTWINVNPKLLYGGGFNSHIIGNPKLLVRQTGDRVIAALDGSGLYHLNNVHSFSPNAANSGLNLHFVDGIMNSNLWLYLYQLKTREQGRPLAQVDIETVEYMPVPSDLTFAHKIATLVEQAAQAESAPDVVQQLERAIDRMVYASYCLSEEQIRHVENYCCPLTSLSGTLPNVDEALDLADSLPASLDLPVP